MPNIAAIFQDIAIFKGVEGCVLNDTETRKRGKPELVLVCIAHKAVMRWKEWVQSYLNLEKR